MSESPTAPPATPGDPGALPPSAPSAPAADEARQAGRGVIYIGLAKIYFILAGAVIEFTLPRLLSTAVFGAYGVVAFTASIVNNVLITGTIQAVSRFTSHAPEHSRAVQAAGLRMHMLVGLPIAIAFAAASPALAHFYHDADKTGPLALAAAIIAGYAFYSVFVGTANGRREFHKQAGLDVSFATLRAVGVLGLAGAGFGLYGAIGGWVAAVAVILLLAMVVVGLPGRKDRQAPATETPPATATAPAPSDAVSPALSIRPMASFLVSVGIYLALFNLLMMVDGSLLKRLTTEWFAARADSLGDIARGLLPADELAKLAQLSPSALADAQVGYYRAVQNLARLSYQAILAATFVVFPLISRSTFASDETATRRYIHTTMRYSLIFAAMIAAVMAANPRQILDVPYTAAYAYTGAPALVALALGNVAFAVFAIAGTILNGAGLTRSAIAVAAVTLVVAVVANAIVIPRFDPGRDVLLAAATATGGSMVLGAALGGWVLHRRLGAFVSPWTVVRVAAATAAAIGLGQVIQVEGFVMTVAEAAVIAVAFVAVLAMTRELTGQDLAMVTRLAGRRRAK